MALVPLWMWWYILCGLHVYSFASFSRPDPSSISVYLVPLAKVFGGIPKYCLICTKSSELLKIVTLKLPVAWWTKNDHIIIKWIFWDKLTKLSKSNLTKCNQNIPLVLMNPTHRLLGRLEFISNPSVLKIEALIWISIWRALKFQHCNWRAYLNLGCQWKFFKEI